VTSRRRPQTNQRVCQQSQQRSQSCRPAHERQTASPHPQQPVARPMMTPALASYPSETTCRPQPMPREMPSVLFAPKGGREVVDAGPAPATRPTNMMKAQPQQQVMQGGLPNQYFTVQRQRCEPKVQSQHTQERQPPTQPEPSSAPPQPTSPPAKPEPPMRHFTVMSPTYCKTPLQINLDPREKMVHPQSLQASQSQHNISGDGDVNKVRHSVKGQEREPFYVMNQAGQPCYMTTTQVSNLGSGIDHPAPQWLSAQDGNQSASEAAYPVRFPKQTLTAAQDEPLITWKKDKQDSFGTLLVQRGTSNMVVRVPLYPDGSVIDGGQQQVGKQQQMTASTKIFYNLALILILLISAVWAYLY